MNKYKFFFRSASVFSNWYFCEFNDGENNFNCVEQYMMFKKAVLFEDYEVAKKIIETPYNPKYYKKMGRKVKNFNQKIWNENKTQIVYDGCRFKFSQNKKLKEILLNTDGIFVEASPYDKIWGVGLSSDDPRIHDERNWKGQNLLGKILTKLRNEFTRNHLEN